MEQHSLSSSNLNPMVSNTEETRISGSHTQRRLPNEIMTLIIHYLSEQRGTLHECALVSKEFYVIANHLLWKVLDFRKIAAERFFASLSDTSPQRLATLANFIHKLCLADYWTDTQLARFAPHMPHLTHLKIDLWSANDTSFQTLLHHYPTLLSLSLRSYYLTDMDLTAISHHWRQLRALECTTRRSSPALELLTCPLEHLKINTSIELTEKSMAALQSFDLVSLQLHGPVCEQIMTLAWPRLTATSLVVWNMLNDTLIRFLQSHPQLTHLALNYPKNLTKTTLHAINRYLPHLASFIVLGNDHLSNDDVRRWVQQSPSLTSAQFYSCRLLSLDAFPASRRSNHHLVHLDQRAIQQIKTAISSGVV